MRYVVIERHHQDIVVHGPFVTEYAARVYKTRLESFAPNSDYEIKYLIPEKNLLK